MSIFNFLGDLIKPVTDMVDNLHTSEEEKLTLKTKMMSIQNEMAIKVLNYEQKIMETQASIIVAEAQGGSSLQRLWRPITMLTFLCLVVCDSFGWLASPLAPQAWTLLQLGLGGYVVGRSAEKIVPHLKGKS